MMGNRQRILPLGVQAPATLEGYYPCPNAAALHAVLKLVAEPQGLCLYLYGPGGVGKSHLLLGAAAALAGWTPYMDCGDVPHLFNRIKDFEGFSSLVAAPLLCLDNIEAWAGQRDKETFLFDLYNERMSNGRPMLLAGRAAPRFLDWALPDWASRASACLQVALRLPDDTERMAILQEMAQRRGLQIGVEAAHYLLRHHARDPRTLDGLLTILDAGSWEHQREVTIPFIRLCLGAEKP